MSMQCYFTHSISTNPRWFFNHDFSKNGIGEEHAICHTDFEEKIQSRHPKISEKVTKLPKTFTCPACGREYDTISAKDITKSVRGRLLDTSESADVVDSLASNDSVINVSDKTQVDHLNTERNRRAIREIVNDHPIKCCLLVSLLIGCVVIFALKVFPINVI